jgi:hypothetical protein
MTLLFPYLQVPTPHPVYCLGGVFFRWRPIIPVTLVGPGGTHLCHGRLDTCADDTVFPEWMAQRLGLDLTAAPVGQGTGVAGGSISLRYAHIEIRVTDGQEYRTWSACVGFAPAPFRRVLLGQAGVLQYFTAAFHGDRQIAELTINSTDPGT